MNINPALEQIEKALIQKHFVTVPGSQVSLYLPVVMRRFRDRSNSFQE